MKMRDVRDWPVSTQIAATCLVVALVLDVAVLLHAHGEMPIAAPLVIAPVTRVVMRPASDVELIRQAAGRAPFGGTPLAEQTLAAVGFAQQSTLPVPSVRPRLLGTVVQGRDGGFVVVELPDARMQLVRIGEKAGDFRLRSVTAGAAVFDEQSGGRITLRTSPPDSRP